MERCLPLSHTALLAQVGARLRTRAVLLVSLWALLFGQGLALWHAQAHGTDAHMGTEQTAAAAFDHEIGAECSLLDHLLGLADAPAPQTLLPAAPAAAAQAWLRTAQCRRAPALAFSARAPPRS
jgi:hypothetical protein